MGSVGAVSRPREAVAGADEALLRPAVHQGKASDHIGVEAGDRGSPLWRARRQFGFDRSIEVRAVTQERSVGETFGQQDVHHRARQRIVRSRANGEVEVGLFGGRGPVRVDHDELRAATSSLRDPRHDIDLGVDRVHAPHDDELAVSHVARIGPDRRANAGKQARLDDARADRLGHSGIAHAANEPLDAVALHEPHRARVVVRPYRFGTIRVRGRGEALGDKIERLVPRRGTKRARAFGPHPNQRTLESVGMMDALMVSAHFRADHAIGVRHFCGAADANQSTVVDFNVQRACPRTVVRTDRSRRRYHAIMLACPPSWASKRSGWHRALFSIGSLCTPVVRSTQPSRRTGVIEPNATAANLVYL